MHRYLLLLLVSLPLAACATDDVREGVISSHLVPCQGLTRDLCMQITETGESPSLLYDGIEGYTFAWGVESTVRYRVEEIEDPPADGASVRYVLEAVLARREESAGTPFTLGFSIDLAEGPWFAPAAAGVVSLGDTPVACEAALCEQLVAPRTEPFQVSFEHTGTTVPLRATALAPMP